MALHHEFSCRKAILAAMSCERPDSLILPSFPWQPLAFRKVWSVVCNWMASTVDFDRPTLSRLRQTERHWSMPTGRKCLALCASEPSLFGTGSEDRISTHLVPHVPPCSFSRLLPTVPPHPLPGRLRAVVCNFPIHGVQSVGWSVGQ